MSAKVALSVITAGALSAFLLGSKQPGPVHDHFGMHSPTPIVEATMPSDSIARDSIAAPQP